MNPIAKPRAVKKTQASWRDRNPDYAADYRIQQRAAQKQPPEALRLPPPVTKLPWDLAKDEFGAKGDRKSVV